MNKTKKYTWDDIKDIWKCTSAYEIKSTIIRPIQNLLRVIPTNNDKTSTIYHSIDFYFRYKLGYSATDVHLIKLLNRIHTDDELLAFLIGCMKHINHKCYKEYNSDLIYTMRHTVPSELKSFTSWHHTMSVPFESSILINFDFHSLCKSDSDTEIRLLLEKVTADIIIQLTPFVNQLQKVYDGKYLKNYISQNET